MTREEADKLQETINEYIKLRDEIPEAEEDAPKDKFRTIKLPGGKSRVVRAPTKRSAVNMMKMQLAMFFSVRIPDVEVGGFDMSLILGPLVSMFGNKDPKKTMPGLVAVVDGHEDADDDDPDYEAKYCVTVPGDVWREALNIKSTRKVAEMSIKDIEDKS